MFHLIDKWKLKKLLVNKFSLITQKIFNLKLKIKKNIKKKKKKKNKKKNNSKKKKKKKKKLLKS